MTPRICPREADVLHLLTIGQWPRQAGADLVSHVAGCESCADVITVAAALRELDDEEVEVGSVSLPDAGAVWQRAQWQARQDAVLRASRPVAAVQGVAAAGVIALIVAGIIWLTVSIPATSDVAGGVQATRDAVSTSMTTFASLFAVEVPATLLWTIGAAVGLGTTLVGVAVGLSTLADLHSEPRRR